MELGEIIEGSGRSSVRVFGLGVLGETETLESRKVLLQGQRKEPIVSIWDLSNIAVANLDVLHALTGGRKRDGEASGKDDNKSGQPKKTGQG